MAISCREAAGVVLPSAPPHPPRTSPAMILRCPSLAVLALSGIQANGVLGIFQGESATMGTQLCSALVIKRFHVEYPTFPEWRGKRALKNLGTRRRVPRNGFLYRRRSHCLGLKVAYKVDPGLPRSQPLGIQCMEGGSGYGADFQSFSVTPGDLTVERIAIPSSFMD